MSQPVIPEHCTPNIKRSIEFLLVSGVARSGTSLMMQILGAGGWHLLQDEDRPPDADNPLGYFEWEGTKHLRGKPDIIRDAEGKVVKITSTLLTLLPNRHRYRVIFMHRPIEEIVESQFKVIARRRHKAEDAAVPEEERSAMTRRLRSHLDWTFEHLRVSANFEVLEIDYPSLVAQPGDWVRRIAEFAGRADPDEVTLARMAAAVHPELYRSRGPVA